MPSGPAAVLGLSWALQGMKKGRRPRRRPRLKLFDRTGPARGPVPVESALFPAEMAGFLVFSRPVPVYPVFLNILSPYTLSGLFSLVGVGFCVGFCENRPFVIITNISIKLHKQN